MVPSEKVPVAVSCRELRWATEGFVGVTAIEVRTAEVTVTVVAPDTPPRVAAIVALPTPIPVTRPWLPGASLTVASDGAEEIQATFLAAFACHIVHKPASGRSECERRPAAANLLECDF